MPPRLPDCAALRQKNPWEKQINQASGNGAAAQTYRFEFGSDENIFSVSFKGVFPEQEIRCILEALAAAVMRAAILPCQGLLPDRMAGMNTISSGSSSSATRPAAGSSPILPSGRIRTDTTCLRLMRRMGNRSSPLLAVWTWQSS